jgi:hypothetical protein
VVDPALMTPLVCIALDPAFTEAAANAPVVVAPHSSASRPNPRSRTVAANTPVVVAPRLVDPALSVCLEGTANAPRRGAVPRRAASARAARRFGFFLKPVV